MNNIIAAQETTGVFERKEKKYVLTRDVLESFLNSIHLHLVPDERDITRVSSLYYDTPENTLISRSLEKPVYKEKIRIRAYGDVDENSEVFVELKKKFKGIVYKRRFSCTLSEAEAFMTGNSKEETDRNYLEVKACRDRYSNLQAKMLIVTNRLALYTNDGSDIRLTIDFNPTYDSVNLDMKKDAMHLFLLDKDKCILEIKSAGALPMWMIEQMSRMQIRPQSFSKYGEAFKKSKQIERKSNVLGVAPKHARLKEVACV